MKHYSRVYAQIDLDAIEYNLEQMKNNLSPSTKIMAVVKTDGYGHGAIPITKKIEKLPYIEGFAVATAEEAFQLRRHGITKKILILGVCFEEDYEELIKQDITLNIFQPDIAKALSETALKLGKTIKLHLKLDTAMCRLGVPANEETVALAKQIKALPAIELEGVFTHFSKADETDKTTALAQLQQFNHFIDMCKKEGVLFSYIHCSNSAATIDLKEANMSFVRAGISVYGLYPSNEVCKKNVILKPALQLKSKIVYLKEVEAGTPVGYGGSFITNKKTKIATIPVGYGDGYPRGLSNKGYVLIHGKKASIIGRICMDQFMVDVTEIADVKAGDEATLVGQDGEAYIGVEELGELSGRFPYEFVCGISKRVPRIYVKNEKEWPEENILA